MSALGAIDALMQSRYLHIEVELAPVGSPTIQPTTFANTGTSFYVDPDGQLSAVVDSVASMANQLELTIWDEAREEPVPAVAALPWVRVLQDGKLYTTSRRAAHRLNAASLMSGALAPGGETFESALKSKLGEPEPPILPKLADAVWEYDPLAILHGCWFPGVWNGRARLTRALSARIDARDVETQSVQTGGQKTADALQEVGERQSRTGQQNTGQQKTADARQEVGEDQAEAKADKEPTVFGDIPHYTDEISARRIESHLLLDIGLLRSYALGKERERALCAVGVLQLRELIDAWPRRRSRCVLDVREPKVRRPQGWELPQATELREACRQACQAATGTERAEPHVVHFSRKAEKASK